jgi:hypothetical protein
MSLPFTHDQFLDVFAAYNSGLWFAAAILWLLTAGAVGWLATGRAGCRWISALLVVHWLWSGAVYHLTYFVEINPAARIFGIAFIVEAGLFAWSGLVRSQFGFQWTRAGGVRNILAVVFSVYAVAYPLLVLTAGLGWPRMPAFAVPCPTTLLTVGLLLSAQSGRTRMVAIIPLTWCFIAGSAALVLGVPPDLALLLAGFALLVDLFTPRALSRLRAA